MAKLGLIVAAMVATATATAPAGAAVALPTYSSFTFTGTCRDCTGVGVGTLKLQNYTVGQNLTTDNFVEFTYASNLLPNVDVTSVASLTGNLAVIPRANTVFFNTAGYTFTFGSSAGGFWCLGGACADDDGPTHIWSSPNPAPGVPEAASWAMMLAGFGMIGLAMRRGRTAVSFG